MQNTKNTSKSPFVVLILTSFAIALFFGCGQQENQSETQAFFNVGHNESGKPVNKFLRFYRIHKKQDELQKPSKISAKDIFCAIYEESTDVEKIKSEVVTKKPITFGQLKKAVSVQTPTERALQQGTGSAVNSAIGTFVLSAAFQLLGKRNPAAVLIPSAGVGAIAGAVFGTLAYFEGQKINDSLAKQAASKTLYQVNNPGYLPRVKNSLISEGLASESDLSCESFLN